MILSPRQGRRLATMKGNTILGAQKNLTGTLTLISQEHIGHRPEILSSSMETTQPVWSANEAGARPPTIHKDPPRVTVLINDYYCVTQWVCVEMARRVETFVDNCQTLNVNVFAVNHDTFYC